MEKIIDVKYGKNHTEKAKEKLAEQMLKLIEFTQAHLARTDNIVSIKVSNQTHTLSIQPK